MERVTLPAGEPSTGEGLLVVVVEPREGTFDARLVDAEGRVLQELTGYRTVELPAADPEEAVLLANLTWSAKESALKALRTGLRRDTRSVEVELESTDGDDSGDAWHSLTVTDCVTGATWPGRWRQVGDAALTVVADQPLMVVL